MPAPFIAAKITQCDLCVKHLKAQNSVCYAFGILGARDKHGKGLSRKTRTPVLQSQSGGNTHAWLPGPPLAVLPEVQNHFLRSDRLNRHAASYAEQF